MVVYALICLLSLFLPGWVYSTNRDITVESGAIQSELFGISEQLKDMGIEAAKLDQSITIERGVTSYYSDWFDGRQMANGQIFHQDRRVIAHKSLPFGTAVFLVAGDHITFSTVQDRGPYIPGRTWDISRGMAQEIGLVRPGVMEVEAYILTPLDK